MSSVQLANRCWRRQVIPQPNHHLIQMVEHISFNYTTVLNIIALLVVGWLIYLNVKHPMRMRR